MIRRAVAVPAAVLSAACLIAGCSSSGSSSPKSPASSSTSSNSSSSAPGSSSGAAAPAGGASSSTGTPNGTAALASALAKGLATVTSLHLTFSGTASGQKLSGAGDQTLKNGKVANLQVATSLPGAGEFEIVRVGGVTYAKLPAAIAKTAKPWVKLSTSSSNPQIARLATSLNTALQTGSIEQIAIFVTAVQSLQKLGTESIGGVPATHYRLTIAVDKLPTSFATKQALEQAGLTTLPVDLWLDQQNRPVKFLEKFTISSATVDVTGLFTKYNQPVTISAPPASEVGTG